MYFGIALMRCGSKRLPTAILAAPPSILPAFQPANPLLNAALSLRGMLFLTNHGWSKNHQQKYQVRCSSSQRHANQRREFPPVGRNFSLFSAFSTAHGDRWLLARQQQAWHQVLVFTEKHTPGSIREGPKKAGNGAEYGDPGKTPKGQLQRGVSMHPQMSLRLTAPPSTHFFVVWLE
jgi:hypothetical protein